MTSILLKLGVPILLIAGITIIASLYKNETQKYNQLKGTTDAYIQEINQYNKKNATLQANEATQGALYARNSKLLNDRLLHYQQATMYAKNTATSGANATNTTAIIDKLKIQVNGLQRYVVKLEDYAKYGYKYGYTCYNKLTNLQNFIRDDNKERL